jgi:nucleotide-binding universal stress UspA family protein
LAARIARRHRSSVLIAHVADDDDHLHRRAMAEDAADIKDATGSEPVTVSETGSPADRIAALAEQHGVSLVVIGSSGRTGIKALGSVSERVAHRARCSVLVARPLLRRP